MNPNFNEFELSRFLDNNLHKLAVSVQNQIQTPMPIVVSLILTALTASMQSFVKIRLPIGIAVPTSLYICTIADSGERKTSTQNLFLTGLKKFETQQQALDKDRNKQNDSNKLIWNLKQRDLLKKIKKSISKQNEQAIETFAVQLAQLEDEKPTDIPCSKVIYDDVTIESLIFQLNKSNLGGLYVTSEAGSVFKNMTSKHTAALNTLWDAETIRIDRKTSDSFEVNNVLSCAFALQPDLFAEAFSKKENLIRGSGLLARMLVCAPQSIQGFRRTIEAFTNYDLVDFNERIETLCAFAEKLKQSNEAIELEFDEQARALWMSAANQIEQQISETGLYRSIKDIASKVMNNASRIAALLHFYHHGVIEGNQSRVTEAELQSALNLMCYFTNEALCLFGEESEEQLRFKYAK